MIKNNFRLLLISYCLILLPVAVWANKPRQYYMITIYHFKNPEQEKIIDSYLSQAYLPAIHNKGIKNIGVFKPVTNDTMIDKTIYLIVPLKNLQQSVSLSESIWQDKEFQQNGKEYLEASFKNPPYIRVEKILLRAFPMAPMMTLPNLNGPKKERIFELRSYESATEELHQNKVRMFNEGGEIRIFSRLDFNAVFYATVISGSHMPNLMYMTSFENMTARDTHWKNFTDDMEWKKLSPQPEYQNNVSKIEILLMNPTEYSDY